MKRMFLSFVVIILVVEVLFSETFFQKIHKDKESGQITEVQAVYLEALRVYAPEKLPEEYKQLVDFPVKCGLRVGLQVRNFWQKFTPEQKAVLKPVVYRPNPQYSFVSPSERFKIHYDITGGNGVSSDDLDQSGVPDYVEEAAKAMDYVYLVEVEQIGFNPPPDDRNRDGPEWDVYIKNLPNNYGWTQPDQRLSHDPDVWISYIELDNDYTHTRTKGLDGLRVTAAHEFFHMIQLGYNFRDRNKDLFMMEASSTWMEDVVYDDLNDYYQYLPLFFNDTNVSFDQSDGWREYGLCLWFHFLEKRFIGKEIIKDIWNEIVKHPAIEATDAALRKKGHTFSEELSLFYGWNYMTDSRADTLRFYPEGNVYPEIKLDGDFVFQLDTTINEEVQPTASRYYRFSMSNGTCFTLVPTNVNWLYDSLSEKVTLAMIRSEKHPLYTNLEQGVQARLISEDYLYWRCIAVVESPGQQALLIPFGGTQKVVLDEDLPSTFPNPFFAQNQSMITIPFILDEPSHIKVVIFSSSGYRMKEEEKFYNSNGLQFYYWNGKDEKNEQVSSGIYVYVVSTENKLIRRNKFAVVR